MTDVGSGFAGLSTNRRTLLKGLAGAAGLSAFGGLVAACSSSSGTPSAAASTGKATGTVSFGSNYSGPGVKAAFASLTAGATAAPGVQVKINTVDHNTFQNNITSYLQGTPDDLFTW